MKVGTNMVWKVKLRVLKHVMVRKLCSKMVKNVICNGKMKWDIELRIKMNESVKVRGL